MLDREKLLNDLKKMKEQDERKFMETETSEEMQFAQGSIVNLETLIEGIEEGYYDKGSSSPQTPRLRRVK